MENHISVSELCKLIARNNVGDCVQVTAIATKEELPESFEEWVDKTDAVINKAKSFFWDHYARAMTWHIVTGKWCW